MPNGEAFYDNIMLWAVKNNMTGVNVQRRAGGGAWDDPAKDIGAVIQWVHKNIAQYKGNPNRVFIWSHSAGNPPVGTYLGRPELYGPDGIGVKGAILMSPRRIQYRSHQRRWRTRRVVVPVAVVVPLGAALVLRLREPAAVVPPAGLLVAELAAVLRPKVVPAAVHPVAAGGRTGGAPGGAARGTAPGGGGGRGRRQVDAATQVDRSALQGIRDAKISFFLAYAELDPATMGSFINTLADQIKMAGNHPTVLEFKAHSHMSEVFSPGSPDTSVSGPILKWMKGVK